MNRRSFVFGTAALIVPIPGIVRAASLMDLRGYPLDPKMLAFRFPDDGNFYLSAFANQGLLPHHMPNPLSYKMLPQSQVFGWGWGKQVT